MLSRSSQPSENPNQPLSSQMEMCKKKKKKNFSSSPSTTTIFFLFFFLLTSSLFDSIYAEDDDEDDHGEKKTTPVTPLGANCETNLKINTNLLPFDTSSLKCYKAWDKQDFTLMFKESEPGSWSFVLSAPDQNGYIAVGFSPNGKMVKSSAVAGWMSATGKGMAKQYYLGGETSQACKPDTGNLQLVPGKTLILSQSSRLYLAFQISNTSSPLTNLIYAVGPKGSVPAADFLLAEHVDMASTNINYESGEGEEGGGEEDSLQFSHGLLALLGWGVLVPTGVLFARYAKGWDPMWFYSHMVVQGLGFGLGVATIVTGFKLEDKNGDEVDTHKAIGIVILVLGTLQVMAVLARPDKMSKVRKHWNWYHHYLGRAAIVLAIANIFYGLSLADEENSWKIGYGVFLGVWGLASLLLEARMCMRRDREEL